MVAWKQTNKKKKKRSRGLLVSDSTVRVDNWKEEVTTDMYLHVYMYIDKHDIPTLLGGY